MPLGSRSPCRVCVLREYQGATQNVNEEAAGAGYFLGKRLDGLWLPARAVLSNPTLLNKLLLMEDIPRVVWDSKSNFWEFHGRFDR